VTAAAPAASAPGVPATPSLSAAASAGAPQAAPAEASVPRPAATPEPATPAPSAAPAPPSPQTAALAPPAASPSAAAPAAEVPAIPAPPPPAAASAATTHVYGITSGPVRVVIKAAADSWVQVRDANQSVLQMRVLKAGDTLRVPEKTGLTLRTGNAGGLEITVDGKPVPAVGPVGKTRTVSLDPEKLVAGTSADE
jgi:cytoskeletal protein RodZ